MPSAQDVLDTTEEQMMEAVAAMERDFAGYRTGKASPALVEGLMVEYYGTQTRLRDIAGITAPEPRLLVIQPWDQNALPNIEKAIRSSSIGISPKNDGRVLRLPIPELSEERRRDLTKQTKKRAEEAKVTLRTHRRDANENAKQIQKSATITEDELNVLLKKIQHLTDQYSAQIDELTAKKEKEIMTV